MELCNFRKSLLGASESNGVELLLSLVFVLFVVLLGEVPLEPFLLEKLGVLPHSAHEDEDLKHKG